MSDEHRPADTTRWEKTPTGLGRGNHTFGMPASYTPPEVAAWPAPAIVGVVGEGGRVTWSTPRSTPPAAAAVQALFPNDHREA